MQEPERFLWRAYHDGHNLIVATYVGQHFWGEVLGDDDDIKVDH